MQVRYLDTMQEACSSLRHEIVSGRLHLADALKTIPTTQQPQESTYHGHNVKVKLVEHPF